MFSLQCGTQIPDGSKFCMFCGAKLEVQMAAATSQSTGVDVSDDPAPTSGKDSQPNIFTASGSVPLSNAAEQMASPYAIKFCGRELRFEHSFEQYNALRLRFLDRGNAIQKEFADYYKANVHDFDTLFDNGLEYFLVKSKEFLQFCVSVVHEYGVHDIDEEYFLQFSNEAKTFCSAMNYYREVAVQLTNLAETMTSYRAAKFARRSYWQGGGLGLAGAIKGALTASALNLGTDVMHSLGNAVSNSSDRAKLRKIELDIYRERNHCDGMTGALNSWFQIMWKVTETVLTEQHLLEIPVFDTGKALESIKKAEDIVRNATASTPVSEFEQAIDLICQGLPYDPYFPITAYTALYQIPQTDKSEIQRLVQFLGLEAQYNKKKKELIDDMVAPILKMPESTIPQIDEKLRVLRNWHRNFPDSDIYQYTRPLEEKKDNMRRAEVEAAVKRELTPIFQMPENTLHDINKKLTALETVAGNSDFDSVLGDDIGKLREKKAVLEREAEEQSLHQRNKEENVKKFEVIKEKPEATLAQIKEKYDEIPADFSTEEMQVEKKRLSIKLKKAEQWESLKTAFPEDLDPRIYAKRLVANVIFRTIYDKIDIDFEKTLFIITKYFGSDGMFCILSNESLKENLSRFKTMKSTFADFNECEVPLLFILSSTVGSRSGVILTTQHLFVGPNGSNYTYSFPLQNITSLKLIADKSDPKHPTFNLLINDNIETRVFRGAVEDIGQENIISIIQFFIDLCLYWASSKCHFGQTDTLFKHILKDAEVTFDEFRKHTIQAKEYSKSNTDTSSSGCFITSAVYRTFGKSDDCYELTTFRNFRDNWLAKQPDGQALIQEYYQIAPSIVEHIDRRSNSKDIYQTIWITYLLPCLHYIEKQQFDECKNTYIAMVNDLKRKYGEVK